MNPKTTLANNVAAKFIEGFIRFLPESQPLRLARQFAGVPDKLKA